MHTTLIRIGNSRGVRLPKAVIEQAGLEEDLDLQVVDGAVIIRSTDHARRDWGKAAEKCHLAEEDDFDEWDVTVTDFEGGW